jgi:hypothetical protein
MMGSKERHFAPFSNVSLEELVPADHFYRHLERTLDLTFVREFVHETYAGGGRPTIDPVVLFKLQLVMFFEGMRSERQLMRHAADRLSVRWYVGYDLGEPLPDHSSLTRFRWKLRPRFARGDTKYGTIENIKALEDTGIRAYVPLPDWEERYEVWSASHFLYDPQADQYRCPQGQMLQRVGGVHPDGRQLYRAPASICNACSVKGQCTTSTQGRRVYRHVGEEYLERVRTYQQTLAYQIALRKRQVWVEPLFAEAKDWHGLRRFRLRRLWRVNCEALLIATGQNLKRLLKQRGWGRRPFPVGTLSAFFLASYW